MVKKGETMPVIALSSYASLPFPILKACAWVKCNALLSVFVIKVLESFQLVSPNYGCKFRSNLSLTLCSVCNAIVPLW